MRRLAVAAVLAAALFTAAACGPDTNTEPSAAGTSASVAAATPSASPTGSADRAVCTDVARLDSESAAKITAALQTAAAAKDRVTGQKAVDEANAATSAWAQQLKAQAGKAQNPQFATALTDLSAQVQKLTSADATPQQLTAAIKKGATTLATYCG